MKAITRFQEEFVELFAKFAESYPDVAHRGVQALFVPAVTAADHRHFREVFSRATTPEEFLRLLEQAVGVRSESEVARSFVPARRPQTDAAAEEGIDAHGPRL